MKHNIFLFPMLLMLVMLGVTLPNGTAQQSEIFASNSNTSVSEFVSGDSLKTPPSRGSVSDMGSSGRGKERKKADEVYKDLGYKTSVDLYHNLSNKEKKNLDVLAKMANSYRLNHETEEAEYWYSKFIHQTNDATHLLHFAQVLQSNDKCEDAVRWYEKYVKVAPRKDRENRDFIKNCKDQENFKENEVVQIENVEILNSDHLDFSPIPFEEGLVFTSTRGLDRMSIKKDNWTKDNFSDLFISRFNDEGKLGKPSPLFGEINGDYHDGAATFNGSGSIMIFTRNNNDGKSKKGLIDLKIYSARKEGKYWSDIAELPFNSDEYTTCHPTLSDDGRRLYFASNRPGGYGGLDIYVVDSEGGGWGTPHNLGPTVNSSGNELFPFINADEELYYASNGHRGIGGLDIFKAQKVDQEDEGSWSIRDNMGKKFNTQKDDFGFWISKDKQHGYLSSSRKKGKGGDDIYKWVAGEDMAPGMGGYARNICVFEQGSGNRVTDASVTIVENTPNYEGRNYLDTNDRHLMLTLKPVDEKEDEYVLGIKQQNLDDTNKKIMLTDKEGLVNHKIKPNKEYLFLVEKNGFILSKKVVSGRELLDNEEFCIPIKRTGCKMLNGIVKNKDYNKLLPNVKVKVLDKCTGEEQEFLTGKDGSFSYCIECGCEYQIRASKDRFGMDVEFLSTMAADCNPGEPVNTLIELGQRNIVSVEPSPTPSTPVVTTPATPIISAPSVRYVPKVTYEPRTTYVPQTTYVATTTYVPAHEMTPDMLNNHFLGDPNVSYEAGMLINIKDIYYNFNKADIRLDASHDLDRIVQLMRTYPNMKISMESHTDARGTTVYNNQLSVSRAREARTYIVSKGIDSNRIIAQGFGESRLKNRCGDGVNCNEVEHQQNRRTEIRILQVE